MVKRFRVYFPSFCNHKTSDLTLRRPWVVPSHFILAQMPFRPHSSLTASFSHVVLQPWSTALFPSSETDRVSGWEISRARHVHRWYLIVLSTPILGTIRFASWLHVIGFWYPPEKTMVGIIAIHIQGSKWEPGIRSIFTTCIQSMAFWKSLSTFADRALRTLVKCKVSDGKEAASLDLIIHLKKMQRT